ncbi:polysaccharide deacetylase [Sneathiella sp. CAU 1612]|uniref:Chitooligosaccharide deacetylase n=1 Tax=Sneathiella sedimenti TaxID=2816034 RepID=A0ABS3F0X6_9PROT|nr:polysaccharide deacetylase [Sneathiella sedimenti]MBO0332161.1 polysaccharide deacetylase [Sneathiella sedimenti]
MSPYIVCLSFDFDAVSSWIVKGRTTPTLMSRGEFGAVGAPRILDLLREYNIKSSWFIPGVTLYSYPEICEKIAAGGHEIGHHGWSHIPPASLSREEEREQLILGNEAIQKLTGQKARGYRSPSWDLSAHSVELLLEEGFQYDSSMMGNDYAPYPVRRGDRVHQDARVDFGPPTELIEMPISWSTDDFPHFEYVRNKNSVLPGLRSTSDVLENWLGDFDYLQQKLDWGILTYTCHPFCIGRGHRMLMLEKLIVELMDRGARFLTMEEALTEYKQRESAE